MPRPRSPLPQSAAAASATLPASNPFAKPSTLPFQTPDFSKIKDSDYLPAILAGMAQQKREIAAIANSPRSADLRQHGGCDGTLGPAARARQPRLLAVNGANTNDTLQATDTKTSPLLAAHNDYIYLNPKLFQRMKTLHDNQAEPEPQPRTGEASRRLLQAVRQCRRASCRPAKQTQLKQMNQRLSTLQTEFGQKLLAAAKAGALHVTDKAALAGLSEEQIAPPRRAAKDRKLDGYVLPLQNTTQQPALELADQPRHAPGLFDASINRAEHGDANDTANIVSELAQLRAQKAALLGFANYADYTL